MTVTLTSEAYGKLPGETYTGPEEAWLLAQGYASKADYDDDTAAALTGTTNAINVVTGGNLVVAVDQEEYTVAIATSDTPAQAATKIDTALTGVADAAIVSSKLKVTAGTAGPETSIRVVSGTGTVLSNLGLSAGQEARGTEGGPGVSNTGPSDTTPANDPTLASNREVPPHPYAADPSFDPGVLDPAIATLNEDAEDRVGGYDPLSGEPYPRYSFDAGGVEDDASVVDTVTPSSGVRNGGVAVEIKGIGFESATGVTFGGTAGTSFSVVDDETIHVTTPLKAAGAYDVVVVDALGNGTKVNGYTAVAPDVTAVTPATGPAAGGTVVKVTGTNFSAAITGVTFGGNAGTAVTRNGNEITVTTPAHAAGAVNVVLVDAAGNITETNGFTYTA